MIASFADIVAVAWLPVDKTLASLDFDGAVKLWNTDAGRLLRTIRGVPRSESPFSPDGRMLAAARTAMIYLAETETGRPLGVLLPITAEKSVALSPDGHYRGSPRVERELVYVVETEHGQETLWPEEFAAKYGWKNDPERVRLAR